MLRQGQSRMRHARARLRARREYRTLADSQVRRCSMSRRSTPERIDAAHEAAHGGDWSSAA
jgi:hypothetical protein